LTQLLVAAGSTSSTISNVEPGLLGFLVVAALGAALVFLLRSMNKQFRKIGPAPEEPEDAEDAEAAGASAAPSQRPLRGLAAHRAALAAAARADAEPQADDRSDAQRG
jgi:hypothetical protein